MTWTITVRQWNFSLTGKCVYLGSGFFLPGSVMNFRLSKVSHPHLLPALCCRIPGPCSEQSLLTSGAPGKADPAHPSSFSTGTFDVPSAMMCKYLNINVWMCEYGFTEWIRQIIFCNIPFSPLQPPEHDPLTAFFWVPRSGEARGDLSHRAANTE